MRDKRTGSIALGLALLLLVWLAAGVGKPWCLDNGLRLLAASGPQPGTVTDLDMVINTGPLAPVTSDELKRSTYPVAAPFVHWRGGSPQLVFPTLHLALLWFFSQLGSAGPVLLAFCSGLCVAWTARRFMRSLGASDGDLIWLPSLLASPVLFYLGTTWEVGLVSAIVLLLMQEGRRPLHPAFSALYGLLPWLRPEALLFSLGAFWLVQGSARRIWLASTLLLGVGLHRAMTGSWLWLQVVENVAGSSWRPWHTMGVLSLPGVDGPWLWLSIPLAALALWQALRSSWQGWVAYGALLAAFLAAQLSSASVLPSWGLMICAPLAFVEVLRQILHLRQQPLQREAILLLAFLLVVGLASPVAEGFHWGPRLWIPALLALGLMGVWQLPAGPVRRAALGMGMALQVVGVAILAQRHHAWSVQEALMSRLRAPALIVGESWLLGDHPRLAQDRLIYLPWGRDAAQKLLPALAGRGVQELDVLTRPGHPLLNFLEQHHALQAEGAPLSIPGGALIQSLEWRRYRLRPR